MTHIDMRCEVARCDRPVSSRRMCSKHYQRWYHGKPIEDPQLCMIDGCKGLHRAFGYCDRHYEFLLRRERVTPETRPESHFTWHAWPADIL